MSTIYFKSHDPKHFLIDSKGGLYEVSEEIAEAHKKVNPKSTATVSHIDKDTNTIWFSSPLPPEVKADESKNA